ncbi:pyruvate kinase [Desulfonema magnum]|uniref:Pyruvate kinase n=1 Tax=Desulfonema magnum TaxID=45655 RepID=A0A975BRM0_9BACT|nr:pyruvate kinase [Desulfonema magnum]QTA90366.1 Pyruvate kinase [Desulfonema magnum]
MPKTKIICTIGPSSGTSEIIRELIIHGMNVARLNFSHGTHEEHKEKINIIRAISKELNKPVAILQDLCGPKIRVGNICEPGIRLEPGQTFILTNQAIQSDHRRVSVSYENLPSEVRPEDRILLADGVMELLVKKTTPTEIYCEVITGGILTSHKGINLPTGSVKADAMTDKDKADLLFGLKNDVDYVALSFVKTAEDILKLKNIIRKENKQTPVVAKIEKHEALDNIEEIMSASDGIMVARGDLGVEIPLENVPGIQKQLVKKANIMGKPVIIATQMLRSMVNSVRPTRAEATDVANAVLDGADAVMLSEETASGNFPVQAVRFMVRIAENAEKNFPHARYLRFTPEKNVAESVAHASCVLSDHLNAAAIVATTRSGFTAMQISRFRPKTKIIALSPEKRTIRQLALYWGCFPSFVPETGNTDERIEKAAVSAIETGKVSKGDLIVITTGHPVWAAGTTNMMRVKRL